MPNEILSGMKWHLNQSCHPGLDAWKLTRTSGVIKSRGRVTASFGGLYVLQPLKKKKKIIPKRHSMKPRLSEQLRFLQEVHHFCKPLHSFRPPFFFLYSLLCTDMLILKSVFVCAMISGKVTKREPENIFKKKQQMGRVRNLKFLVFLREEH